MLRIAAALAGLLLLGYGAACGALYFFQRSFIYYPQAHAHKTPRLAVRSDAGVEVVATVREHAGPDAVLYLGGNAEDVSQSLPGLHEAFPAHALYLLHYRGYGASGGQPTEESIQQDALALFDLVQARHANVVVVGRSLGTGVAIRLASQRPAQRLVLVTPYDSLQALAVMRFPYFPVRWLLADRFDSWKYVAGVKAPTLVIAAEHDTVIPRDSTQRLFERFPAGAARLVVIPGVEHNDILQHPLYLRALAGEP
jgi:pimeloyl-ACP methyl ester carboxylesterase